MKLSEKKRNEIYESVYQPLMKLRVDVRQLVSHDRELSIKLDDLLYKAQNEAASGAVRVAAAGRVKTTPQD